MPHKSTRTTMERFVSFIIVDTNTGCHNWQGSPKPGTKYGHRYGNFKVQGKQTTAHRWIYFHLNPDADRSLMVCHTCDNPKCVNPEHLWLGTAKDNVRDCRSKGRHPGGFKSGSAHPRAGMNEDQARRCLEMRANGIMPAEIAKELMVSKHSVEWCIKGGWSHVERPSKGA